MAKSVSVDLKGTQEEFVSQQIAAGAYATAPELLRDAVRVLQMRYEHHRAKLQALIEQGYASGEGRVIDDADAYLADIRARGRAELREATHHA